MLKIKELKKSELFKRIANKVEFEVIQIGRGENSEGTNKNNERITNQGSFDFGNGAGLGDGKGNGRGIISWRDGETGCGCGRGLSYDNLLHKVYVLINRSRNEKGISDKIPVTRSTASLSGEKFDELLHKAVSQ